MILTTINNINKSFFLKKYTIKGRFDCYILLNKTFAYRNNRKVCLCI